MGLLAWLMPPIASSHLSGIRKTAECGVFLQPQAPRSRLRLAANAPHFLFSRPFQKRTFNRWRGRGRVGGRTGRERFSNKLLGGGGAKPSESTLRFAFLPFERGEAGEEEEPLPFSPLGSSLREGR
ncbi:hypothetical protein TNCV_859041 [Trichonephila clavipes]|nr:hypothetical protein TNCV_859041 [Trichonephila clavipes]